MFFFFCPRVDAAVKQTKMCPVLCSELDVVTHRWVLRCWVRWISRKPRSRTLKSSITAYFWWKYPMIHQFFLKSSYPANCRWLSWRVTTMTSRKTRINRYEFPIPVSADRDGVTSYMSFTGNLYRDWKRTLSHIYSIYGHNMYIHHSYEKSHIFCWRLKTWP